MNMLNVAKVNKSKVSVLIVLAGFLLSSCLPLVVDNSVDAITARTAIDVVLVIDASGSMSGTKIDNAKSAAKNFINQMQPGDQVSVIPFSDSVANPIQHLTTDFSAARTYIDDSSHYSFGGTDYIAALDAASIELNSSYRNFSSTPVMIFLSDGAPNTEVGVLGKCTAMKAAGVQIFTIALGAGSDILSKMASSTTGTTDHYFNGANPGDLAAIYNTIAVSLVKLLSLAGPSIVRNATNVNLGATILNLKKSVVIKASGTVKISGNILNDPSKIYTDISQIPQLVIIANKIVINSTVTKVDAWLIAKNSIGTGEIDTCNIGISAKETINDCNQQLIVNGPVMTDHLHLLRTAGSCSSDPTLNTGIQGCDGQLGVLFNSSTPAEIFNLRADAYLWAAAHAVVNGRVQTVYTTELPPRF